jgi:hypothetical protein
VNPLSVRLPDHRLWLRVADPSWDDPLDTSFSKARGGRWNAPGAFDVLYLSADPLTAVLQIDRLLVGTPFAAEDLDDDAFNLLVVQLPTDQRAANLSTDAGLATCGLPSTYPRDSAGELITHSVCQPIGATLHEIPMDGILCRSAASHDGRGRELAWFARMRSAQLIPRTLSFGEWRNAHAWADLELPPQAEVSG